MFKWLSEQELRRQLKRELALFLLFLLLLTLVILATGLGKA